MTCVTCSVVAATTLVFFILIQHLSIEVLNAKKWYLSRRAKEEYHFNHTSVRVDKYQNCN